MRTFRIRCLNIEECVGRMDRVMTRLSEYSRLAFGELVFEEVDLKAVIKERAAALSGQLSERSCGVRIEALPKVWGDRIALARVFDELMGNAIKASVEDRPGWIRDSGAACSG